MRRGRALGVARYGEQWFVSVLLSSEKDRKLRRVRRGQLRGVCARMQHANIIVRMSDRVCVCVQVCLRRDGREHAIIRAEASCQPQNFTQLVLDTLRRRFNITGEWLWVISTHIMRNAYTIIVVLNSSDYPLLQHSLLKIFSMSRFQILTLLRSVFNIK